MKNLRRLAALAAVALWLLVHFPALALAQEGRPEAGHDPTHGVESDERRRADTDGRGREDDHVTAVDQVSRRKTLSEKPDAQIHDIDTLAAEAEQQNKAKQDGEKKSDAFSSEKQALVDMAKRDKKTGGITEEDMKAYKDLNAGLTDPFPNNKVRGPESHLSGEPSSQAPHVHIGPVDHIPIKGRNNE